GSGEARGEGCHAAERAGGKGAGQIGSQTGDGADPQGDQQLTTQAPQPQQAGAQGGQLAATGRPHRADLLAGPAQRRANATTQAGRGGSDRGWETLDKRGHGAGGADQRKQFGGGQNLGQRRLHGLLDRLGGGRLDRRSD